MRWYWALSTGCAVRPMKKERHGKEACRQLFLYSLADTGRLPAGFCNDWAGNGHILNRTFVKRVWGKKKLRKILDKFYLANSSGELSRRKENVGLTKKF